MGIFAVIGRGPRRSGGRAGSGGVRGEHDEHRAGGRAAPLCPGVTARPTKYRMPEFAPGETRSSTQTEGGRLVFMAGTLPDEAPCRRGCRQVQALELFADAGFFLDGGHLILQLAFHRGSRLTGAKGQR